MALPSPVDTVRTAPIGAVETNRVHSPHQNAHPLWLIPSENSRSQKAFAFWLRPTLYFAVGFTISFLTSRSVDF